MTDGPDQGAQGHPLAPPTGQPGVQRPVIALPRPDRSGSRVRPLLLGALLGIVVAVLAGAALSVTNVIHWGDDGGTSAADTRPISLGETAGGLQTELSVIRSKNVSQADKRGAVYERTKQLTADEFSKAFGGASTAVEMYADNGLETHITVVAVRGQTTRLTAGVVSDPADLGLAAPLQEVVQVGDVDCLVVHTQFTPAGKAPDPNDERVSICQRTGPGLTVQVSGSAPEGPGGRRLMARVVGDVWTSLSDGTG